MANKKKKKTKRVYNKKKKSIIIDNRLSNIVSIVILLFLDLFILLSLLGYCGFIGDFVKLCILSIFGTIGYFFPLIFIIQILFKIFYKSNKYKIYILLLFFISIIGLVSTLIGQEFTSNDVINNIIRDNNISLAWFSFEKGKFGAGGIVNFFQFLFYKFCWAKWHSYYMGCLTNTYKLIFFWFRNFTSVIYFVVQCGYVYTKYNKNYK